MEVLLMLIPVIFILYQMSAYDVVYPGGINNTTCTSVDCVPEWRTIAAAPEIRENIEQQPFKGDDKLTFRMLENGQHAKQAIVNRAMMDKYTFAPYLKEELDMHANLPWWEDDSLDAKFDRKFGHGPDCVTQGCA
jgi:hypothetical protein